MFNAQQQGAITLISGNGPIASSTLEELGRLLDECLAASHRRIVFNLTEVPLFDSAGLEWLLDASDSCAALGGQLQLAAANLLCRDILRITGIGNRFETFEDVRTAVRSFSR